MLKPLEAKNFPDLHYIAVKTAICSGAVTDKFNCSKSHSMTHPRDIVD